MSHRKQELLTIREHWVHPGIDGGSMIVLIVLVFCGVFLLVFVLCLVPSIAHVSGFSIHGRPFGFLSRLYSTKHLQMSVQVSNCFTPSSGLSDEEVERMVKDAEAHAEEDKKVTELVSARNTAEGMINALHSKIF